MNSCLKYRHKGVGSLIAGLFVIMIVISFLVAYLGIQRAEMNYAKDIIGNLDKKREILDTRVNITSITLINGIELNITVKNLGSSSVLIYYIGVFNRDNRSGEYYNASLIGESEKHVLVNPDVIQTNITTFESLNENLASGHWIIQLLSENGIITTGEYPPPSTGNVSINRWIDGNYSPVVFSRDSVATLGEAPYTKYIYPYYAFNSTGYYKSGNLASVKYNDSDYYAITSTVSGTRIESLKCSDLTRIYGSVDGDYNYTWNIDNYKQNITETLKPWLVGWNYRKAIVIDNTQNSYNLTDYQINVILTTSNFNYSKANSDGSDIRFTDLDSTTLLNYWIEKWNTTGTSIIWVKVPNIPALSKKTIYMYYGNSSATSESNGTKTFDYFDTGDLSGWTVEGNSGQDTSDGDPAPSLYAYSVRGDYMYKDINLTTERIITFNVKTNGFPYFGNGLGNFYFLVDSNGRGQMYRLDTRGDHDYSGFAKTNNWRNWYAPSSGFLTTDANIWFKFGIVIKGSTADLYWEETNDSGPELPSTYNGSYTISNNGGYIGLVGDALDRWYSIHRTWWDNIIVRKYASSEPSVTMGEEETNGYTMDIYYSFNTFIDSRSIINMNIIVYGYTSGEPIHLALYNWAKNSWDQLYNNITNTGNDEWTNNTLSSGFSDYIYNGEIRLRYYTIEDTSGADTVYINYQAIKIKYKVGYAAILETNFKTDINPNNILVVEFNTILKNNESATINFYLYNFSSDEWDRIHSYNYADTNIYILYKFVINNGFSDYVNSSGVFRLRIESTNSSATQPLEQDTNLVGSYIEENRLTPVIYVGRGGYRELYIYFTSSNSWIKRTDAPFTWNGNISMAYNYGNSLLYVVRNDTLYNYSAVDDEWENITSAPNQSKEGSSLIYLQGYPDILFYIPGGGTSYLYKYNITENNWYTLTSIPENTTGYTLATGSDNYIYVIIGGKSENFYRYNISSDDWNILEYAPATEVNGLAYSQGLIYLSDMGGGLHRYSINKNEWTPLTPKIPVSSSDTGNHLFIANSRLYYIRMDYTREILYIDIDKLSS